MTLRDIQNKITSVKKTAKVTKAMESVSAVKMRKAQQDALQARVYAHAAIDILRRLSHKVGRRISEVFAQQHGGKTCIILVGPSKGLAGALVSNLYKKVEQELAERSLGGDDLAFVTVGKKALDYVKREGYTLEKHYEEITDKSDGAVVEVIAKECLALFQKNTYSGFLCIYTNFISTTEQEAVARQVLPIQSDELENFINNVIPSKGKFADLADTHKVPSEIKQVVNYMFEPEAESLMRDMVPQLLHIGIFYSLLESRASEHSARMMAMKNATDKAGDMIKDLNRKFNKQRQAAITAEISEIVGGMETV